MLYATTRGKYDVVTAHKAIHTDCYGDGGLFVPFRLPTLDRTQLETLQADSAAQTVANVLNALFSCDLRSWDVEAAVGRKPLRLMTIGRRVAACELWSSADGDGEKLACALSDRLRGQTGQTPTDWVRIAVGIALLFAAYAAARHSGLVRDGQKPDVAVATGDFSAPMAAWYARQMGLPIGNILCGCNENGGFWDLLNRGELDTGAAVIATCTPEADLPLPPDLERLIHGLFGVEEVRRYLQICEKKGRYVLTEQQLSLLDGLFAAVISDSRVGTIIPGVYRTRGYILSPYAALAYGCLQDFRATSGEENPTLVLADRNPCRDAQQVCRLLKIGERDLKKRLTR